MRNRQEDWLQLKQRLHPWKLQAPHTRIDGSSTGSETCNSNEESSRNTLKEDILLDR